MCGARAVATSSPLFAQVIVGLSGSADSGTHLSAAAKGDQALLFLRRAALQAQRKSIDVVRTYTHLFICVQCTFTVQSTLQYKQLGANIAMPHLGGPQYCTCALVHLPSSLLLLVRFVCV